MNVIKTIIKNRKDTYENWTTNNPILSAGEVGLVEMQSSTNNKIITLTVIGDGVHSFNELTYSYGLAADVYDWAKQPQKPTYDASEISCLSEAISHAIENSMNSSSEEPLIGLVYAYGTFYDSIVGSTGGSWLNYWGQIDNNSKYKVRVFYMLGESSGHLDLDPNTNSGHIEVGGTSSPDLTITQVIRIA